MTERHTRAAEPDTECLEQTRRVLLPVSVAHLSTWELGVGQLEQTLWWV